MLSVGRMIEKDGTVYEGSWKDDLKDGDGVGKKHGQGTQISKDGRSYTGQWKDGLMDGHGET